MYFSIFGHFDAFTIGILLSLYHKKIYINISLVRALSIISILVIFLIYPSVNNIALEYICVILSSAFLIYVATLKQNILNPLFIGKVLHYIGRRSYFIYLMHLLVAYISRKPLNYLFSSIAVYIPHLNYLINKNSATLTHIQNILILFVIVGLSELFNKFVEQPFTIKYK